MLSSCGAGRDGRGNTDGGGAEGDGEGHVLASATSGSTEGDE